MTEPSKVCEHCGAKTVEYKHTFSDALAVGLFKLYAAGGGPINLKDLALTRNQWDNFQKLRYWQLVGQSYRKDGTRMNGYWHITSVGKIFIETWATVYLNLCGHIEANLCALKGILFSLTICTRLFMYSVMSM
jgi:hypothetical protein